MAIKLDQTATQIGNSIAADMVDIFKALTTLKNTHYVAKQYQGGVVSEYGVIQFENPPTSNARIFISTLRASGSPRLLASSVSLQGATLPINRWFSSPGGATSVAPKLRVYAGTTGTPLSEVNAFFGNSYDTLNYPFCLDPGDFIGFRGSNVNNALEIAIEIFEVPKHR